MEKVVFDSWTRTPATLASWLVVFFPSVAVEGDEG